MKLIGFSGAQGQGKSTLISELQDRDAYFMGVPLQTSRQLLAEWGYTLAEVNKYMPLKIKFQEELLLSHCASIESELGHIRNITGESDPDLAVMIERTFADVFTYALVSVGPFNEYSDWLNEYSERCMKAQELYFDNVIFLTGRTYVPEDDGVRSINPH